MKEGCPDKVFDILIGIGSSYAFLRKPIERMTVTESLSVRLLGTDGLRIYLASGYVPVKEDLAKDESAGEE